ncbi:MAG: GNAT family N-acetyltransferase [Candidatus Bipolaricaulaceae bacterium]
MAELRIRGFRLRDFPQVLDLAQSSFPEEMALWGFTPARGFALFCAYGALRAWQRLRTRLLFQFYIGEVAGRVVAGAMVEWRKHYAYVQTVMVHPEFRGKGIGRRIVEHAVAEAFHLGAPKVVLHVRPDNPPALRLYTRLGFRPFEERVVLVREGREPVQGKPWPPRFRLLRARPWDPRVQAVREAAREPEAARVYGPPELPEFPWAFLLRGLHPEFGKTWLLLDAQGQPVAALSLNPRAPMWLSVDLRPEERGQGLEEALLSFGVGQARGPTCLLRADARDVPLLRAAHKLGFEERMRELGMVREKER